MLKKHWRFLNWTFNEPYVSQEKNDGKVLSVFSVILLIFMMVFTGMIHAQMNMWSYLFFYLMCFGCMSYKNGFGRLEKLFPVKDSFVVNNILFVIPSAYALLFATALGLFGLIMQALMYIVMFDSSFIQGIVDALGEILRSFDVMRIIFSVSIVAGIWFLMSLQIFYRKLSRRLAGHCGVAAFYVIYAVCVSNVMKSAGVTGEYNYSEVIYVLPTAPVVAGAAVFAFVSGVYSWNRAMYLYRHDVAGQAEISYKKADTYGKSKMALYSEDGKKARIFAVVGVLSIWTLVMFFLLHNVGRGLGGETIDSGSGEVNYTSSSPSEYGDWNSCLEREGVPESAEAFLYDGLQQMIIFPSEINEDYIKEYYAKVDGDYSYKVYESENCDEPESSGSWDMQFARFMVADYPKEEFEKECDRLANLSYKDDYDDEEYEENVVENHVLVDEDNFPAKTYIAVYNYSYKEYEYAIADEDCGRIIYVFLNYCESIPTDIKYKAKNHNKVVPLTKRNYGRGYSIYQEEY